MFTKTALAAAIAIALTASFATDVSAQKRTNPSTNTKKMTTWSGGSSTARADEHCNNVASCNIMIAYCISTGGEFQVDGNDPEGKPNKGTCKY